MPLFQLIGFYGRNCEFNEHECVSKPYQNGTVCIDGINKLHMQLFVWIHEFRVHIYV